MASYTPYRGRRRGGKVAAVVVGVLLVLIIVAVVLVATEQIVFTADGPRFASSVSASPSEAPTPSFEPSAEPSLIIEQPSVEPSAEPSPSPTPVAPERIVAVQLDPRDETAFSGAVQLARDELINSVVLRLDDGFGNLSYISAVESAAQSGANAAPTSAFDLGRIQTLKDEGLYVAVRISALRESNLWNIFPDCAVKWANGTRWLDRDYSGWLDPYSDAARDYLEALMLELFDAGADEVIFDNFSFPTSGQTSVTAYPGESEKSRSAAIDDLYGALSASADTLGGELTRGGSGKRVSVAATADAAEGSANYASLSAQGLAVPSGARAWLAGGADGALRVVSLSEDYTSPAAPAEIAAALAGADGGILLVSGNGRYPASW